MCESLMKRRCIFFPKHFLKLYAMVAAEESRLVSQSQCVSTVWKEWEDGNEWLQIYILECSAMGREYGQS